MVNRLAALPRAENRYANNRLTTPDPTRRRLPTAAAVLRRGLLVWGLGHISIGDRRGWALLLTQPIAIAGLLLVAAQLIDGTRWLIVFPPLAALLVVWLAQAVHAYRRAVELGAQPGGELQAGLFLPVAVTVLTLFWLVGGRHGSPTATLEGYALAWMSGRADAASSLYVAPPTTAQLAETWALQSAYIRDRIATLATQYGPTSGLDPERPFDNLRFGEPTPDGPGRQRVQMDIVRLQRVETMVLGVVPTAGQQTVLVEQAGVITLALVPQPPAEWLPVGRLDSSSWRIDGVTIGGP